MTRNKPATKLDMDALVEDVKRYPDAYYRERAERLNVALTTIRSGLIRLGISYKKKHSNTQKPAKKNGKPFDKELNNMKLKEKVLFI